MNRGFSEGSPGGFPEQSLGGFPGDTPGDFQKELLEDSKNELVEMGYLIFSSSLTRSTQSKATTIRCRETSHAKNGAELESETPTRETPGGFLDDI